MKAYKHLPTGTIYPIHGCMNGFDPKPTRMKWFWRGKGWMTTPLKQWQAMDLPDLPKDFTLAQFRAYAAEYGVICAREFLPCCDMIKPTWGALRVDPAYPDDETQNWAARTFKVDARACSVWVLACMAGRYSFDLLAFEEHLQKVWGYPKDTLYGEMDKLECVSIRSFMVATFGEENTARFERTFLPREEPTNAKNGAELAVVNSSP